MAFLRPEQLPVADPGDPDTRSPARLLLWVGRQQRGTLLAGVLFGVLWMVAQALIPFAIGRAIQLGIVDKDNHALAVWTLVLLGLGATQAAAGVMRHRLAVPPLQYRRVAYLTLAALTLIVLTGAAVRLTGSGLGCPDWPKCYGKALPPISTHALIEFSNRALSGLVGVMTVIAAVLAFTRRPFRRDLAVLAVLLPLGVVAQAVLGGFTVREHLAPGFVMAHFALSMIVLVAAVALAWRSAYEPGARPRSAAGLYVRGWRSFPPRSRGAWSGASSWSEPWS